MQMISAAWKYATALAAALIVLNPEMIELALFVDAIGLELFLMQLEIQVAAIICALLEASLCIYNTHLRNLPSENIMEKYR
ncbi:MAG: hypothetical protein ABW201_08215 [Candidatus Thiodiazotropha sp.]